VNIRSVRAGLLAAAGLAIFYAAVVGGVSRSLSHLGAQMASDWAWLALILLGFATQVALIWELRRRHRMNRTAAATTGAGTGASAAGMVACCAHHMADLAPFLGAGAAATFLLDYRIPFMVVGIGVNAVGVAIAVRRLRHLPRPAEVSQQCVVA